MIGSGRAAMRRRLAELERDRTGPLDVHLAQRALAAGESLDGFPPLAREHAQRLAAFVVAVQPLNPILPEAT